MRLQEKPDRVNIRFRRKKEENKKHEQSSTLRNSSPFTLTTIKTLKEKGWKRTTTLFNKKSSNDANFVSFDSVRNNSS